MHVDVLRQVKDWLDSIVYGVNALLDGAGTNSALGSCSFADGTYWAGQAGYTIATATSCIAGQTAYKHTDVGGVAHSRRQAVGTFVNAQTDCVSVILENVDATISDIGFFDTTAGAWAAKATLTWATKASAITTGSGTTGVIDLGTGPNGGAMVRVWATFTGTAAGTGAAGNTRTAYVLPSGETVNTKIAIWHHAQFEAGKSTPSAPIITAGSAVSRASVPLDAADGTLPDVTILEASTTAWVARGLIDRTQVGTSAMLLVQLGEEGVTALIEDGRQVPNQAQVSVVLRYVTRKTDSAAGLSQAYSTLRVAARSLMLQAARTSVTRNTTTIGPVLGMSFAPALQEVADDYVVDSLQVVLGVWDAWALGAT